MKILAITQARIGSTRLPAKIIKRINGETLLEIHLKRIQKSKLISKLKVATTTEAEDLTIVEICSKLNIAAYKGSVNDVLERFYLAAKPENPDWIVRLTSDCPLIDSLLIDSIVQMAVISDCDYVSNTLNPTFPDGLDIEVFKFSALEKAFTEATMKSDHEHVTPYIWRNSSLKGGKIFTSQSFENDVDYSQIRMTVDKLEDFLVIESLVNALGLNCTWEAYVDYIKKHNEISELNNIFKRNEGYANSLKND
jgi:spore coat polysaccharide biosynthesis protein SpsF